MDMLKCTYCGRVQPKASPRWQCTVWHGIYLIPWEPVFEPDLTLDISPVKTVKLGRGMQEILTGLPYTTEECKRLIVHARETYLDNDSYNHRCSYCHKELDQSDIDWVNSL